MNNTLSISESQSRATDFSALHLAAFLIVFMTAVTLPTAVLLIFGITVTPFHLIGGLLIALALVLFGPLFDLGLSGKVRLALCGCALIVLFLAVSGVVFDNTWDGAAYHKQAIGLLNDGWNPLRISAAAFNELSGSTPYSAANPLFWAEVYPKVTWYFSAPVYALTGNIECGKAYTLLFMTIAFCVFFDYLRVKFASNVRPAIIALLAAANPIAAAQFQSYYLDGLVCCLIMTVFLLFSAMLDADYPRDRRLMLLCTVCLIIIGCNTKFSAALFLGSITIGFFVLYAIDFVRGRVRFVKPVRLFLIFAGTAIAAIPIAGWSPYITNTLRYKSPLYGLLGGGDVNLLSAENLEMSGAIEGLNNTQMFLASLFGRMSHGEYKAAGDLIKMPFTVSWNELGFYNFVDTRVGGMGVLFSGIFLASCAILLILCVLRRRNRFFSPNKICLLVLVSITVLEMLILPASYQARYVGFIYIVPVVALTALLYHGQGTVRKRSNPDSDVRESRIDDGANLSVQRPDSDVRESRIDDDENLSAQRPDSDVHGDESRFETAKTAKIAKPAKPAKVAAVVAAVALSALMVLNCMPWGYPALRRVIESVHTTAALKDMASADRAEPYEILFCVRDAEGIALRYTDFSGLNYNLRDFGVSYVISDADSAGDDFRVTYFNWIYYKQKHEERG
jgi:hypothetical protein